MSTILSVWRRSCICNFKGFENECTQDFEPASEEKQTTVITMEPCGITGIEDFKSVENEKSMPVSNPNFVEVTDASHFQKGNMQKPVDDKEFADRDNEGPMTLPDESTMGFYSGQVHAGNLTTSVIKGDNNAVTFITQPTRPTSLRRDEFNNQEHDSAIITRPETGPERSRDVGEFIAEKVPAVTKTRYTETETTNHGINRNTSLEDVGHTSSQKGVSMTVFKTNIQGTDPNGHVQTENTMIATRTSNNNGLGITSLRNPASLGKHQEFNNQKGPCSLAGRGFSEELLLVPVILKFSFCSEQSCSIVICGVVSYRKSQAVRDYIQTLKDAKFPMLWTNAAENLFVPRSCFVQIAGSQNVLVFDKRECFISEEFTNSLSQLLLQAHNTGWEINKAMILNVADRTWQKFEPLKDFVPEELQPLLLNFFELGEGNQNVSEGVSPHIEETRTTIMTTNYVSEISSWMLQNCPSTSK